MEKLGIYKSIYERTQGDIYVGIVGPVRTGKSTFIKRFMDLMVVPNIDNIYEKERLLDELPQSGSGKTIMTTEPKFVPADSVAFTLPGNVNLKMRMVDCVGYMVPEALGHMEDGKSRMVSTPWSEKPMAFEEAAEIGTRRVIQEHSTIGVVVTTDGTIGDIPHKSYVAAEGRVIKELKALGKPFVVVVNSVNPDGIEAKRVAEQLSNQYGVNPKVLNCTTMSIEDIQDILLEALMQFPASQINFYFPGFVEGLSIEHWIKSGMIENVKEWMGKPETMQQVKESVCAIADGSIISNISITNMDLGNGSIDIQVELEEGLFYKVIEELMEHPVKNDGEFFELLKEFAAAKKSYDKLKDALEQVEKEGYGIVQPKLSEMILEEPEVFKQGSKYGVSLKAKAPSLHIIKTDITTEVSPVVGTEKQSEELIKHLMSECKNDPSKIWDTNIFGKSLYEMVTEQMETKLLNVPDNIRVKVQKSLQRISDEGKDYFICIIL